MTKLQAMFLLCEDKFWEKMTDIFPSLVYDNSIRWKLRPESMIKRAVKEYGSLSKMWDKYNLKY